LPPPLLTRSPKTSWTFCSLMLLAPATLKPEDHWASSPFCLDVRIWASWPCNEQLFVSNRFVNKSYVFVSLVALLISLT
jgi:hypothetical protein